MSLPDTSNRPRIEVQGDTVVIVQHPNAGEYYVRYVGIGHPWHTIGPTGGREATPCEYAFAQAAIAMSSSPRAERALEEIAEGDCSCDGDGEVDCYPCIANAALSRKEAPS